MLSNNLIEKTPIAVLGKITFSKRLSLRSLIPSDLMNEKLHVRVETDWTFSDIPLKEELEFDLD